MKKLCVSYYMTIEDLPLIAADKLGFFEEEGIEVEPFFERPSRKRVEALADGRVQFATGLGNRMGAIANPGLHKSSDFKIICVTLRGGQDPLVSYPVFGSLDDLFSYCGKTGARAKVSINGYNCTDHLILEKRLVDAGFAPAVIKRAIEFVEMESSAKRVAAFSQKPPALDAGLLHPPYNFVSEIMGFNFLLGLDQRQMPFSATPKKGLAVTGKYLKENPDEVELMLKIIFRGIDWIFSVSAAELKNKMISWFEYEKVAEEANNLHLKIRGRPAEAPATAQMITERSYDYLKPRLNPSGIVPDEDLILFAKLHTLKGEPPSPGTFTDFRIVEKIRIEKLKRQIAPFVGQFGYDF